MLLRKFFGLTLAMVLAIAAALTVTGAGNAQEGVNSSALSKPVTLPSMDGKTEETLRKIGFEISDGVAFFPERRGTDAHRLLWHLFALMADPDIIEDRNFTMNFARAFLPESALEPYVTVRMRVPEWCGDNEFQQDDSRRAFLDAHRSTLLALAPELPMALANSFPLEFRTYDHATASLTIVQNGDGPLGEIQRALPLFGGTFLKFPMSEDEAHQYVEGSFPSVRQAGIDYRPTLGIRYVVKDARLDKVGDRWGLGLEVELVDRALYADQGLTVPLRVLPNPRNVRVYGSEASVAQGSLPVIDNFAQRIMIARMVPELGQSQPVIARLFEVRRQEEREALRLGRETSFPPAIPRTLVNGDIKPTAADLDTFVQWIDRNAPKQGDNVLMDRVLHHGTARRTLHNFWAHGGTAVYSGGGELIKLTRDASPDSFAFINTDNEIGKTSYIVFALSAGGAHLWRDETLLADYAEPDQVRLEVQILHTAIRRSSNGKAVMIVEVHPIALRVKHGDGTEIRRELPQVDQTVSQDRTDPGSRFDILGVKPGMSVDEARKLLREAYGGETRTAPPASGATSQSCARTLANVSRLLGARLATSEASLQQAQIFHETAVRRAQESPSESSEAALEAERISFEATQKEIEAEMAQTRIDIVRDRYDALLAADCITADMPFDTSGGVEALAKLVEIRFSGAQFGVSSELPTTVRLEPVVAPGLTFAFASRTYPDEDHLLVFQANDDDGRPAVAAIYRTIRSEDLKNGSSAFADGMSGKFGDPPFTSESMNIWLEAPDDPIARRLFEFGDHACAAPARWNETTVFPKNYLGNDCGVVLLGDHYRAALLDTRFIRQAAEEISAAEDESAATEKQAPAVRF